MSKKGKIRRARFQDVEAIYDVIRENPEEVVPRSFQNLAQNFDRFFVYERQGQILGVISWQPLPILNLKNPDWAIEIISFSVKKPYQKQGIGHLLLERILKEIEKYKPHRILVLTFYPEYFRAFGFRKTSKEKLYSKIYVGCLNCTKYKSPLTCPEVAMEIKIKGVRKR